MNSSKELATKGSSELTTGEPASLPDWAAQEKKRILDERAQAQSRKDRMKLEEGVNTVRVLPGKNGKPPFFKTYLHFVRNAANPKQVKSVICPSKTEGKPCVICAEVSKLRRTGNNVDQKAAQDLSAGMRIFANVIDLSAPDDGVKIAEFGSTIYVALLSHLAAQDESAVGDFTDPDKGRNVVIEKTVGDPKNPKETTRYEVRMAQTPTPISNRKWLSEIHDLSKVAEVVEAEKIRALLEGRDPDAEFSPPEEVAAELMGK